MFKPSNLAFIQPSIKVSDLSWIEKMHHPVDREQIEALKSSILTKGILQKLIAVPCGEAGLDVIAGHTRLMAAAELISEGKISQDYEVPVRVFVDLDTSSAYGLTTTLNKVVIRAQMDFCDECIAMVRLSKKGMKAIDIADIFDCDTQTVVERLLNVRPASLGART